MSPDHVASRNGLNAEAMLQLRSRKGQIEKLRRDIDEARNEIHRGEGIQIPDAVGLRSFFDDIRARGQSRTEVLMSDSQASSSSGRRD